MLAIVTGGASGLGLETVRVLAGAGASVVVPARDPRQAQAALTGLANVDIAPLDLLDPQSVDSFAAAFSPRAAPCTCW
jgi:NAD(P)-dependent dehydrogenase (short-subunit alcohol dehydrogenase family)